MRGRDIENELLIVVVKVSKRRTNKQVRFIPAFHPISRGEGRVKEEKKVEKSKKKLERLVRLVRLRHYTVSPWPQNARVLKSEG